jgi:uncharacterized membrane protein
MTESTISSSETHRSSQESGEPHYGNTKTEVLLIPCAVCGNDFPYSSLAPAALVRPPVAELIRAAAPAWNDRSRICLADLNRFRVAYVRQALEQERGELSTLEEDVLQSLSELDVISANVNEDFQQQITLGQRVADRVASFGGSWLFIFAFGGVVLAWISLNLALSALGSFDPYPFILLNLVLSCVAALQAPVIMMSQNRQEAKDRLRAEHDYRVNLKAELEIRHLHSKLDLLMTHQWQRLLEIQELQTEFLQQIADVERSERNA